MQARSIVTKTPKLINKICIVYVLIQSLAYHAFMMTMMTDDWRYSRRVCFTTEQLAAFIASAAERVNFQGLSVK